MKTSTVRGVRGVGDKLDRLAARIVKKALRSALTKAARPMLRRAKALVPARTGTMKRALASRVWTNPRTGWSGFVVGVRRNALVIDDKGRRIKPDKYLHLVEFGTAPHFIGTGQHPGASPSAFMRRAIDATKGECAAILASSLKPQIQSESHKL